MSQPRKHVVPKLPKPQKCSAQELLFIGFLMQGFSPSEAALAAGYSEGKDGRRLLSVERVEAELRRQREALQERISVNSETVIQEFARVAFANIGDMISVSPLTGDPYLDWDKISPAQKAAISEITITTEGREHDDGIVRTTKNIRVKLHPKLPALEALAKHLGLFAPQQVEVSGKVTVEHQRAEAAKLLEALPETTLKEIELAMQRAGRADAEDAEVIHDD